MSKKSMNDYDGLICGIIMGVALGLAMFCLAVPLAALM